MNIIRWVCEKCNKKWIYPVNKCIYCKGGISKQKGSKIKVIGATKVMIPSPMHPIVPYNIILLQDEFGNRLPRKTMNEYKIGDAFTEKKATKEDAVAVVRIKYDIYESIKESLKLLKDVKFSPEDKILVKPSIIASAYPYQAVNTNPDFLDALLRVLFDYGIKKENVIVAEQALIGSDANDAALKSGITEICKKNGVGFVDISKGPFEELKSEENTFAIFKEALSRRIINVPIMKTNFQIGLSGALENLSRLADEKTQRDMYFNDIEKTLPSFTKMLPEVLTIADASSGMQGLGPLALGEPAFLNLVLAGRNPAHLDSVFCDITMIKTPAYVTSSSKGAGIKETVNEIEVVGNELDALRFPIKQFNANETPHPDIKVIDAKACPACLNMMYSLTSKLVGLRGEQINLVIGSVIDESMLKEKERVVALGDCAIRKLTQMNLGSIEKIEEGIDEIEQIVLLKKLLTTKGKPNLTPIDKVKSKMKRLLARVIK